VTVNIHDPNVYMSGNSVDKVSGAAIRWQRFLPKCGDKILTEAEI
jgi:hypothetical protein